MNRNSVRQFRVLALMIVASIVCVADDTQFWVTYNSQAIALNDQWKTASHAQFRSPELEFLQYGRLSQKFLRGINDNWTFGAHPAVEFKRGSAGESWANDYRVEIEASGKFSIEKGPTLSTRSRWEFILKEGSGSEVFHRCRQQFKVAWSLQGFGIVESYAVSDEMFYELEQGQIVSNRFFPITLGFKSKGKFKTGAWLMYLSQRSKATDDWSGTYVLGADFKF